MSTLKVNTLQDTTGSNQSTASQIFEGRARAWINFDQRVLQDTRNKYGITDFTDLGTGYGRVNFLNTLSNPCAVGSASYNASVTDGLQSERMAIYVTNEYAYYNTTNTNYDFFDCEYIFMAIFCDTNN